MNPAEVAFDVAALGLTAFLMVRLFRSQDRGDKARAQRRGRNQLLLTSRLFKDKHKNPVQLSEYELEVAADVVSPADVTVSFDDVGGLAKQARNLRHALLLPLKHPHLFAKSKLIKPPKGILLHGPPGTGKTLLAKAIAREANFSFIVLNPARLFSKWYGESNKYAEAYFSLARKLAPCIVFIDEIDCLFSKSKQGHEHEASALLRAQFLTLWDGLLTSSDPSSAVVVIAATNKPDDVDPAMLRRLPLSFAVEMPGVEAREEVLLTLLRDEPAAQGLDLAALARETDGYSGSDLEQLCRTAALRPVEELYEQLFERTMAKAAAGEDTAEGMAEEGAAEGGTAEGGTAEGAAAEPLPRARYELRVLELSDFREAMLLVRPSGRRFAHKADAYTPPVPSTFDPDLYD